MADFPLLKQWHFDRARCVIWRDLEGLVFGAAIRGQSPALAVAMPRGAETDQVVAALEAAREAATPRTRAVDTSVITDALLVMRHREINQRSLKMPFRLADDQWMPPAHPNLEQANVHACDSRGRDSYVSVDLRGPRLYVLARTLPAETSSFGWDTDQRLQLAVALSRLIRTTPINLRFAVRITAEFPERLLHIASCGNPWSRSAGRSHEPTRRMASRERCRGIAQASRRVGCVSI